MSNQREILTEKLATARTLIDQADADEWDESLSALDALTQTVDSATITCVKAARNAGATWDEIATYLKVTRSAAWQRFARYTS